MAIERFLLTSCRASKNERASFFYAKQRVNKNRSSIFHGVMFLFHTYWDFFLLKATRLLPSTAKYYRSYLRLDERCIFSRSLSMYEINYGTFNVLRIRFRINTFEHKSFQTWIITICYQNDCLPQSSTLNKTIYFFGERTFPVHVERLKYYPSDPLTRSTRTSSKKQLKWLRWQIFKGLSSSGIK